MRGHTSCSLDLDLTIPDLQVSVLSDPHMLGYQLGKLPFSLFRLSVVSELYSAKQNVCTDPRAGIFVLVQVVENSDGNLSDK